MVVMNMNNEIKVRELGEEVLAEFKEIIDHETFKGMGSELFSAKLGLIRYILDPYEDMQDIRDEIGVIRAW